MYLHLAEAALILKISEKKLLRMVLEGKVPTQSVPTQKEILFDRIELLEWASLQGLPILSGDTETEKVSPFYFPSFVEALMAGGIVFDMEGCDKASAIKESLKNLNHIPTNYLDSLYLACMEREALSSTGIGEGIAIPHVCHPNSAQLSIPIGSTSLARLCFLKQPIEYDAIDKAPVTVLFLLISPNTDVHLHLLSRLGAVLRDKICRKKLAKRANEKELMYRIAKAESRWIQHNKKVKQQSLE